MPLRMQTRMKWPWVISGFIVSNPIRFQHHRQESETVARHQRREENVQLVRIVLLLAQAVDGHPDDGEDPHAEDAPAEVGDFAAFEGVQQADEEERSDHDRAQEAVEVVELRRATS